MCYFMLIKFISLIDYHETNHLIIMVSSLSSSSSSLSSSNSLLHSNMMHSKNLYSNGDYFKQNDFSQPIKFPTNQASQEKIPSEINKNKFQVTRVYLNKEFYQNYNQIYIELSFSYTF